MPSDILIDVELILTVLYIFFFSFFGSCLGYRFLTVK